ncbi:hypothetical protein [Pseudomonas sp. Irchel s3h17]|uniref:hypothetical protein n=1 Tax=Pseudomonas sp. Irchel s3h17 TaxID=2009182 RepID=UPI00117A438D|nr:hypothetical protein [Pseudomonas sp. Irchel s3h17]
MTLSPDDGHAIGLDNNLMTNLSDLHQRMPFVLKATAPFDELLHDGNRYQIEQALRDIAAGGAGDEPGAMSGSTTWCVCTGARCLRFVGGN